MSYTINTIEGIGPSFAEKLAGAGIKTTDDLLAKCADAAGRKKVAAASGVSEKQLLRWANMADLMRISGIGGEYAELLEAAGVDTVRELRSRDPERLAEKAQQINEEKSLTRLVPSAAVIAGWIEKSKQIEPRITH